MANKYPCLQNLPIKDYAAVKPTILIGVKHGQLPLQTIMDNEEEQIAIRIKLGWLMFGNAEFSINNQYAMMIHQDEEIREMMKQNFSIGVKIVEKTLESAESERSKKILNQTLKRSGDRYEVGLLWKNNESNNSLKKKENSHRNPRDCDYVYDPLGLICNITINGMILYQELHVAKLDWDDCIPS